MVLRFKLILIALWATLSLVNAVLCPLEALGILPQDYCCTPFDCSPDNLAHSAKSGCSHDEPAQRSEGQTERKAQKFEKTTDADFFAAADQAVAPPLANEVSSFLSHSWQFQWRAALAPRTPSFHS
jgi:hypothetical protein